jgi:hypothetical protein
MKTSGVPETLDPEEASSVCDGSSHPFDEWLKKELAHQHSTDDAEILPPEMAILARRLEQALGLSNAGENPSGTETDNTDSDRSSANENPSDGGKRYEL